MLEKAKIDLVERMNISLQKILKDRLKEAFRGSGFEVKIDKWCEEFT